MVCALPGRKREEFMKGRAQNRPISLQACWGENFNENPEGKPWQHDYSCAIARCTPAMIRACALELVEERGRK